MKKMKKNLVRSSLLIVAYFTFLGWSGSIFADCGCCSPCELIPEYQPNCWHFLIAPYVWASALTETAKVQDHTADAHVSPNQAFNHLGYAGYIEGGYGPWTLMVDPAYLKLTDDSL